MTLQFMGQDEPFEVVPYKAPLNVRDLVGVGIAIYGAARGKTALSRVGWVLLGYTVSRLAA